MLDLFIDSSPITQAIAWIIVAFAVGKFFSWLFVRILKPLTRKTETLLDDIIIDLLEVPVIFGVTLFGIYQATQIYAPPNEYATWPDSAFSFLLCLTAAWYVNRLYSNLHQTYLMPYAEKTDTDWDDHLLPVLLHGVQFLSWTLAILLGIVLTDYNFPAILLGMIAGAIILLLSSPNQPNKAGLSSLVG